jgi:hypothetical protein
MFKDHSKSDTNNDPETVADILLAGMQRKYNFIIINTITHYIFDIKRSKL